MLSNRNFRSQNILKKLGNNKIRARTIHILKSNTMLNPMLLGIQQRIITYSNNSLLFTVDIQNKLVIGNEQNLIKN